VNCDLLAPYYRFFEYAAFGRSLERHREAYLSNTPIEGRALLLGEGDGRFLAKLTLNRPSLYVDVIERSRGMLRVSGSTLVRASLSSQMERVRWQTADVLKVSFGDGCYDLIASHFFLDCFSTHEAEQLVRAVTSQCRPGTEWLISEFQQPKRGWRRWHAWLWLRVMYAFFRITTALKVNALPQYAAAMREAGWTRIHHSESRAGLICSERWILGNG
jgi:ubiquinone/menaquinone biosynthesis C-methylase UbiE